MASAMEHSRTSIWRKMGWPGRGEASSPDLNKVKRSRFVGTGYAIMPGDRMAGDGVYMKGKSGSQF